MACGHDCDLCDASGVNPWREGSNLLFTYVFDICRTNVCPKVQAVLEGSYLLFTCVCPKVQAVLEGSNLLFTCVFVIEAIIKIAGFGPMEYAKSITHLFDFANTHEFGPVEYAKSIMHLFDFAIVLIGIVEFVKNVTHLFDFAIVLIGFVELFAKHLFDFAIVLIGLVEIRSVAPRAYCLWNSVFTNCLEVEHCSGGGGALSVLRTFRLIRVVKLLTAFPECQKQVRIVVSILGSVANLIVLMVLVIFTILGMNVFGGAVWVVWVEG
ncbi:hypothetical protein T484DRAFT_1802494 [Baffinella frigidus]|nr:hypothetical protein T484DRAFT_1802494 [Cryptophyta sp. CCMP2293]